MRINVILKRCTETPPTRRVLTLVVQVPSAVLVHEHAVRVIHESLRSAPLQSRSAATHLGRREVDLRSEGSSVVAFDRRAIRHSCAARAARSAGRTARARARSGTGYSTRYARSTCRSRSRSVRAQIGGRIVDCRRSRRCKQSARRVGLSHRHAGKAESRDDGSRLEHACRDFIAGEGAGAKLDMCRTYIPAMGPPDRTPKWAGTQEDPVPSVAEAPRRGLAPGRVQARSPRLCRRQEEQ